MLLEISQNSQENTCARVSFLIKLQACARVSFLIKLQAWGLETLAQVFSCEFREISKNTFYQRTPLVAASVSPYYFIRTVADNDVDNVTYLQHDAVITIPGLSRRSMCVHLSNIIVAKCARSSELKICLWDVFRSVRPMDKCTILVLQNDIICLANLTRLLQANSNMRVVVIKLNGEKYQ